MSHTRLLFYPSVSAQAWRALAQAAVVLLIGCLLALMPARAGFDTVATFVPFPNGSSPYSSLIRASDGAYYGTTFDGGAFGRGTVFRLTAAGELSVVASFDGPRGAKPRAGLIEVDDGTFYGTTEKGGAFDLGTVFKLTASGGLSVVASFDGSNGELPYAGLTKANDGALYGTTTGGGAFGHGTVFKVPAAGGVSVVVSFDGGNGSGPYAAPTEAADGALYGTTLVGGQFGQGTVFKLTKDGDLSVITSFNGSNGALPSAGLIKAADGALYGTTAQGGASNKGAVFRLTPASGGLSVVASFNGANGEFPYAGLIQAADGTLYGTTVVGGESDKGTVFSVTTAGTLSAVASFNGSNGSNPYAALIEAADGTLHGTTFVGGVSGKGTVFKVTAAGALSVVADFDDRNGANPDAGLIQAADGRLYGTAVNAGRFGRGTVFSLSPAGGLTGVASFDGSNGANPSAGLIEAADGAFYGTTFDRGAFQRGTIFKLTPAGELSVVASFAGPDGANPLAGLIEGADGSRYGTTQIGGASDRGTVFKVTAAGQLSAVASFAGPNGRNPQSGLIQAADGALYGTTFGGGAFGLGTVFKLEDGKLEAVISFNGSNGQHPVGGLIKAADGAFYGTTSGGGEFGRGTVFKLTLSGQLSVVASFDGSNGASPVARLIEAADGALYGTTRAGGTSGLGTVFRLKAGQLAAVVSFDGSNGANPRAELTLGADGAYYGTTFSGGSANAGVVFRYTPPPAAPANVTAAVALRSVDVNWSAVPGAVKYRVYQSSVAGAQPATPAREVMSTGTVFENLANGRYYYTVSSVTAAGEEGPRSAEVMATVNTPDTFAFASRLDVARDTLVTSDSVPIVGLVEAAAIAVVNGEYALNCDPAAFTAVAGTIGVGQSVCVRHRSAEQPSSTVTTVLTIGGVSADFSSTTAARDVTPDAFSFDARNGVALGSVQTSNEITVTGINEPIPAMSSGGFYGLNGGPCTMVSGVVVQGDRLVACHTASNAFQTDTVTTLTLGADGVLTGVSAQFRSTTIAGPTVELTPTALAFGDQRVGTVSAARAVTLRNGGASLLAISGVTVTAPFQRSGGTCGAELAAGTSCTVEVVFAPAATGTASGTLTVQTAIGSQQVALTGNGVQPVLQLRKGSKTVAAGSTLRFGNVRVGTTSAAITLSLRNTGIGPLTIGSIVATPAEFAIASNSCPASLPQGASCSIALTLTPAAVGTRNGQLQIASNGPLATYTVLLTGSGTTKRK